jgi:5-methylcytosine-specific restriction endonuclease McrA
LKRNKYRVARTRCGGQWTEAKYWSFIRSALRNATRKYPPKWQAKASASRPSQLGDKRVKKEYQCALCGKWFKGKDTQMDHIEPAGKLNCYEDLPDFVRRLFCEADGFRCLCKKCHDSVKERQNG